MADRTEYVRHQTANAGPNWDEYVPQTLADIGGGKFGPKIAVVNPDGTNVGGASATGALTEATFADRIGERQASPTANTVLDRLKALLTGIVLAAGTNVIGKVGIDGAATATTSTVGDSATSVTLLAANAARKGATIYNDSSANLYVKLGATASASDFTALLLGNGSGVGGYYEVPAGFTGRIDGLWASDAGGNARATELT